MSQNKPPGVVVTDPRAELRSEPTSQARATERHRLLALGRRSDGPPLVVATQVGYHQPDRGGSFQAIVASAGERPIVICQDEIVIPASGWELRSSGLWVDHICEAPLSHWSYGLEAFALAIDDAHELLGRAFGDRVPLGWELEFEASGPAVRRAAPPSGGYDQVGRVHGLILLADGEIEIDGPAVRSHDLPDWGPGDELTTTLTTDQDQSAALPEPVALPTPDGVWWVAATANGLRTSLSRAGHDPQAVRR